MCFAQNLTYYAGTMLDAFAILLLAQNYAGIIGSSLHYSTEY